MIISEKPTTNARSLASSRAFMLADTVLALPASMVQISAITLLPLPPRPVTSRNNCQSYRFASTMNNAASTRSALRSLSATERRSHFQKFGACVASVSPSAGGLNGNSLAFNNQSFLLCSRKFPVRVSNTPLLNPIRFLSAPPITGRLNFIVSTANLMAFCE
ncbi:hypothetical protein BvCmsSIP066_00652 [Escherichia coli]|nr:hypothetical protein BvCmsSIP066_00652 [Escherichia coli]